MIHYPEITETWKLPRWVGEKIQVLEIDKTILPDTRQVRVARIIDSEDEEYVVRIEDTSWDRVQVGDEVHIEKRPFGSTLRAKLYVQNPDTFSI